MTRVDLPKLGLGIVGLGRAFQLMAPSIVLHPLVKILAAADLRADAREKFASEFRGKAYTCIEEICQDEKVDLLYIATPHQFHAEQAIIAARHGKHVIVEKPLALTLQDAITVATETERSGTKLIVGHTASYNPPILKMREIVRSAKLGNLRLIHAFHYTSFLYRPRRPEELDPKLGGGILFNQTPHQVDMVRLIGGGLVRSVRACTGIWDAERAVEGSMAAYIDFENGPVATVVYSGYDHFNSDDYNGRSSRSPDSYGARRRMLRNVGSRAEEAALQAATGYGGSNQAWQVPTRPSDLSPATEHETFGQIIVSCDKGDMRAAPEGVLIYGDDGLNKVPAPFGRGGGAKASVIDEIYDAIVFERPLVHHARWALATLEVCLAIQESSRERREIFMSHQTSTGDR